MSILDALEGTVLPDIIFGMNESAYFFSSRSVEQYLNAARHSSTPRRRRSTISA